MDTLRLVDYLNIIYRRRRLIAVVTSATFAASIIVSLFLPKVYVSSSSILPPQQESAFRLDSSYQVAANPSGLSGGFLGARSPADVWVGILKSATLRNEVVKKFKLKELYGADTVEDARKELDKRVGIRKSKEEIITVSVEDKGPELAASLANAFMEELDRINKNLVTTSGKRMRIFIEKRLVESRKDLADLENSLKSFQEGNRAVKIDEQSKAIFEAIGTVKGELIAREVELQTLLSYATERNPQVEILRTQVRELGAKLRELEEGGADVGDRRSNVFIPTARIPGVGLKYARLLRDIKVQETLFELLSQQYEMAKIQELKDTPTVQVLDRAFAPEKKTKPRRTFIVLFSTFSGLCLSVFAAFLIEYLEGSGISLKEWVQLGLKEGTGPIRD